MLYVGNIQYKSEVHAGEHEGIVAQPLWQEVQEVLQIQARTKGAMARNRFGALLKGLLRCVSCGRNMTPSHATRKGKRYRYYVCTGAQKKGWQTCPRPSVAAPAVEQAVLDQLKELVQDRDLVHEAALVGCLADPHWQTLPPLEQARLVRGLVAHVDFHGNAGKLVIALQADGLAQLAEELLECAHDTAPNG